MVVVGVAGSSSSSSCSRRQAVVDTAFLEVQATVWVMVRVAAVGML